VSDLYGVRDAACPVSTRGGGGARLRRARALVLGPLRERLHLWEGDETCPVSTEGGTRRVHFVREGVALASPKQFLLGRASQKKLIPLH